MEQDSDWLDADGNLDELLYSTDRLHLSSISLACTNEPIIDAIVLTMTGYINENK